MTYTCLFSPASEQDIEDIYLYILKDQPSAAEKFLKKFKNQLGIISKFPKSGSIFQPETSVPFEIRYLALPQFSNFVLFYAIHGQQLRLLRLLHIKRDIDALSFQYE